MIRFNPNKLTPKAIQLITYGIFFWLAFLLVRSVWQNWDLRSSILKLNEQITTLEKQKKDLENLIVYYNSETFRELEARKRLGLKKAGEKMVILPATSDLSRAESREVEGPSPMPGNFQEQVQKEKETIAGTSNIEKTPNWRLWWQYFTK